MKIFVCRICGEVYIGKQIAPSCPFCGAANKYFRLAHIYKDENNVELSELSKKNLKDALDLEMSNTSFYKAVSEQSDDMETKMMFKGLYKVELEHAEIFTKLLKIEVPVIAEYGPIGTKEEVIKDSDEREKRAVAFYEKAMGESVEPRVKEVFEAIMNVEREHIELDEEKLA